ncbi:kinesin-like protein NACK2 [Salvia miltiorrhiza]|uniref:kinesin-like protein NACK2 n=1 Tax=Salvia miltiorrhiza TaxID=226208 RepID=UPI0025ABEF54|nr:kinesin-like protein NACK2 [Salvia miltiorrhiza]XP_057806592.1 kinesin-like protein NACK2 [Salvia miltiorrhiza]XP_057806593.1 kinesin-like protein NACK2 [Salvia miltiorrhiza]
MTMAAPVTPPSKIKRSPACTPGGPKVREENILVTVRMRPLSPKELAVYDLVAWDIIDDTTIVSKNLYHDRHGGSYTFDKVFDPTCSTRKVYEEGARDVALSALGGINATIFAYGQTSSGKTFTMRGVAEDAVKDIYKHIKLTPEREFLLKFSALEIYNETVVDLLNRESGSLRLLDDPEKGTVVDKLIEEVVKDDHHLRHLISICEAQRQVGETSLNDRSSRSHQIIRLTIESSLCEDSGCVKSFLASLNLVDLAGSERATQANTDGTRLKEGSHINRSLLTLTTVIRKLSGGKRSGHIPYRDSKLTRILQTSLGGNARTAIICTISSALSHVEQSRNTLSFATSAKEVTNSAQVNMVVEKKQLVKHLKEEVARLEAELRSPDPPSSSSLRSLLREKDMKIKQMEREIYELKRQRDLAQSALELEKSSHKEQKASGHHGPSSHAVKRLSFGIENDFLSQKSDSKLKEHKERKIGGKSTNSTVMLVTEIRKLETRQRQLGEEATRALELLHKEVASQRIGSQGTVETIAKMLSEIKDMHAASFTPDKVRVKDKATLREEIARLHSQGDISVLEEKLENVQRSIEKLVMNLPTCEETPESKSLKKKKGLPFSLSNAANMQNLIRSPCSATVSSNRVMEHDIENRTPERNSVFSGVDSTPRQKRISKNDENHGSALRENMSSQKQSSSINVKKMQRMFKKATEDNIQSIKSYVTELKERVAKLQYQKQLLVCQVLELEEANEASTDDDAETVDKSSPMPWNMTVFEEQRKEIIMLWHVCHVSIVHRTQFYLLFRGDPCDQIYMEVELRRLTWLEQHLDDLGNASPALLGDDPASSVSSSIKALKQEREYLAKRVSSKLSVEEREMLYLKWDIPPEGKQRRRLQLVNKLWTDPLDMQHVKESADVVAKLVGYCESSQPISKEMFALNFVPLSDKKTWMGWNLISNILHL